MKIGWRQIGAWLAVPGLLLLLCLAAAVFLYRIPDVFIGGHVYFVDADCYSRMIRAQDLWQRDLHSISFQRTENWPDGVYTHATMPMDIAIVGLGKVLSPFLENPLPVAGALVSPVLGLVFILALWIWSRKWEVPNRWMMLITAAVSPSLAHAFGVGRPDHQSLEVLLVALALLAEFRILQKAISKSGLQGLAAASARERLVLASAVCWGLALWVSFYEPLILFVLILGLRVLVFGRVAFSRGFLWGHACMVGILSGAWLLDGMRFHRLPMETMEFFGRWSSQIGELRGMAFAAPEGFAWVGWLLPVVPLLLLWRVIRERTRFCGALLILVTACYGLTMWQRRWEYFLVLVFVLSLPWAMQAIRRSWLRWVLFMISLWPIAAQWEMLLYPEGEYAASRIEARQEAVLLRDAAVRLISDDITPVLAPWWLCPPIAYWSHEPTIAGSSHQSLPGIVDTARFYLSEDESEAREILRRRQVFYVFGYEPDRVMGTASPLLGKKGGPESLGVRLFGESGDVPPWLHPVYSNAFFRVYEVREQPRS